MIFRKLYSSLQVSAITFKTREFKTFNTDIEKTHFSFSFFTCPEQVGAFSKDFAIEGSSSPLCQQGH